MKTKVTFQGISPKTWEHPADRATLTVLRKVPGFNELLRKIIGLTTEKSLRLIAMASSVRVSEHQFPKVHTLAREAVHVLDIEQIPEVYVSQNPIMNAGVFGVMSPFVILNSSLVESLTDEELLAVISHEIGHCASGHALYKTLLWIILNIAMLGLHFPGVGMVLLGVVAALKEWDRKSELSADRAALLVVQEANISYELLMKLAGGSFIGEMNINEFFNQAAEYDRGGNILDSVHKLLNLLWQSHPFPVLRLSELKVWLDSGSYDKILSGEYKRREAEEMDDVLKDFNAASQQYKEDLSRSQDPLSQTVSKISEEIEAFSKKAEDFFGSLFNGT
jgi:Zn-dependent protease with chaperone function